MSHYAPYPAYKDSGVAWLGRVPEGWEVKALKYAFKIVGGSTPKSEQQEFWDGDITWVTPSDLSKLDSIFVDESLRKITSAGLASCGAQLVPKGSIVLSTRAPIGSVAVAQRELCTNQGCKSLVPNSQTDSTFFGHLFAVSSVELNNRGKGTTFLELSSDELAAFRVPVPSLATQRAIAAHLDRETVRLDGLVAKKTRFIALLREKRQALITHAVIKGLDPTVKMKDSGVEWLGQVPEHWVVCCVQHVINGIEQGWSPECLSTPADDDQWGVVKSGCVNGGIFDENDNKTLPQELTPMPQYEIRPGDVLMSRASGSPELIGSVALVSTTRNKLMLSDKVFRIACSKNMLATFFVRVMGSRMMRTQIELSISGADGLANNLPQSRIKKLMLVCPPVGEQAEICSYIDRQTARLDTLIEKTERSIALIKERRAALITAAVTGQIDLRAAA